MPRPGASGAILTALQGTYMQPAFFVSIQFATTTVYLWTGSAASSGANSDGSISWMGQTWEGFGSLLGISDIESGSTVEARGIEITISGLDATVLSNFMTEFQLQLPVAVYFSVFSSGSLIARPITSWNGFTDQPSMEIDGISARISMAAETRLISMNVLTNRRHTNEDQQMDYPGDVVFQFVDGIQNLTIFVAGQSNTSSFL